MWHFPQSSPFTPKSPPKTKNPPSAGFVSRLETPADGSLEEGYLHGNITPGGDKHIIESIDTSR